MVVVSVLNSNREAGGRPPGKEGCERASERERKRKVFVFTHLNEEEGEDAPNRGPGAQSDGLAHLRQLVHRQDRLHEAWRELLH